MEKLFQPKADSPQAKDYSKFVLKPTEEILSFLKDEDNIFILSCRKCFKEFKEIKETECDELAKLLSDQGKRMVGCVPIDFLCNRILTEKIISQKKELNTANCLVVISCGIGIQMVAELTDKPVYSAANSIYQGGYHSMALYEEKCAACGNCLLGLTGGICPIVNCAKELVNGPCGGAKNGKCEVDKTKDCGWQKIYERISLLGLVEKFKGSLQYRDYSIPDFKTKNSHILSIREKRYQNFYGGLYPLENKELSKNESIKSAPEPKQVVIPLLQHPGTICKPSVKVGDKVKIGQKIGEEVSYISAPLHSSVSGKVVALEPQNHPCFKEKIMSVVIISDEKNELDESVKPKGELENLSGDEIKKIVKEAGIVGLGGAMFPTYVKLNPPADKKIDVLILNGAECEPYLTSDERVMIERTKDVIYGIEALMKALDVEKGYIVVEKNKPEAIEKLRAKSEELGEKIEVVEVETKYPQGAERMLIKKILNREVPLGGLPFEVGVVVNNVGTAVAVAEAIRTGLPLIKRVVTVTGEKVRNPKNLEVKIGTSFQDLIDFCGGLISCRGDIAYSAEVATKAGYAARENSFEIKMGGPMMGIVQEKLDVPVIKGTTGILVTSAKDIKLDLSRPCIKCGRCVDVCPMMLNPSTLGLYAQMQNWQEMNIEGVMNCIECGCCDYICPAKRSLTESFKLAKKKIKCL